MLLPHFTYGMLRHCSLHNVNLGILATANGSSLNLDRASANVFDWLGFPYTCFKPDHIYIYIYLRALGTWPRLLLIDLGFFGDVEALTLRQCLAVAYKDFRIWCRLNKVKCGQQLFRESTVSWPVDVHHDIIDLVV